MRRRPLPALLATTGLIVLGGLSACSSGGPSSSPSPSASSPSASSPSASSPAAVTSASSPAPATTTRARPTARARTSRPPAPAETAQRPSVAAPTKAVTSSTPAPQPTSGTTIVLNPGHNGGNASHQAEINRSVPAGYGETKACDTTGTNANAGYPEHAFNFGVAERMRAILQARGLRVVMTRPDDNGVGPCVDERAAIGNRDGVAAVITIHADGAPSDGHGFHVNQDSRRPDGATQETADASNRLGLAIRDALASSSGLTPSNYIGSNGMYYRSDFAALNLARKPATFLELGNMRNSGDAALLSSAAGRQRIAESICAGLLHYLGR